MPGHVGEGLGGSGQGLDSQLRPLRGPLARQTQPLSTTLPGDELSKIRLGLTREMGGAQDL